MREMEEENKKISALLL